MKEMPPVFKEFLLNIFYSRVYSSILCSILYFFREFCTMINLKQQEAEAEAEAAAAAAAGHH